MKKIRIKNYKLVFTILILILCVTSFLYYDLVFKEVFARQKSNI